ncbi:MAG: protein kinase [Gammaproteobacteria bacterium]
MAMENTQKDNSSVSSVVAIPGYKIIDILGRGGMAIVYKAIQESIGRTVAIKVLAPNHSDETFTDRFLREAQIISNLTHPNIITVFDAGVVKSHHYMSMEFISGKTMRDARDDLSRKQKVEIIKQIALALEYAGNKGYVHRDIKPENIMLHEDGRAVLMDFGIARGDDTVNSLTLTGKAIGTPYYMSPEQTKGIKVDPRSDIYSLGVVLYQALTGHVPYDGTSFVDVGIKHISQPIPKLPVGLKLFQKIINKAMSKDPIHRYQSASALITDLNAVTLSGLDKIDAKSSVISNKGVDYNSPTMIESDIETPVKKIIKNKSKINGNINSGRKIKNNALHSRETLLPNIDILNTDEFKSLKRRKRLIYLFLLVSIAITIYFNKKTIKPYIEPYWDEYALPLLHEYLPDEVKQKIGLTKIKTKEQSTVVKVVAIKPEKVQKPITLFNIDSFMGDTHDLEIKNNETNKIISESEYSELQKNLDEQPENSAKLIEYYKNSLENDKQNKSARQGVVRLRYWFISQLKESVENEDIKRGKLLLGILKTSFPKITTKEKYQKFENNLLRIESIKTHLRLAEEYFEKKHYIEPESKNALEEINAVFSLDPDNVKAKIIERNILDIFVEQVKSQQANKQYESAIISAEFGLKISNNDAFLKSSHKNLQKLLKVQQQVDGLLRSAKKQMDKGNYVTPTNINAFKIYNSIFDVDVNNKKSLSAIKEIELKLVSQATQAIKANNISNAKLILQLIEQYYPDSTYLKKTQTLLAEAISSKDPAVIKIVFSDVLMSSMEKMEDIRIQSGRLIYFGFQFKNFSKQSNYLLVRLLDHTAVTKIQDKTIVIDGTKGQQIFSIEIPGKGLTPGNYYIELKYGKKSLIKKSFQIYKP